MSLHRPALLVAAFAGAACFFGSAASALADDLYAVSGTTTIAGQTMNVWGYNATGAAITKRSRTRVFPSWSTVWRSAIRCATAVSTSTTAGRRMYAMIAAAPSSRTATVAARLVGWTLFIVTPAS